MTFEDLDAWKKARATVNAVYKMTRQAPLARDFGLCSQIQRAAVSVMSNIAEGFERQNAAEKMQACNIARASCGEVRSLLYVIEDHYELKPICSELRILLNDTGSLVSGLIGATRKRLAAKLGGAAIVLMDASWCGMHFLTTNS